MISRRFLYSLVPLLICSPTQQVSPVADMRRGYQLVAMCLCTLQELVWRSRGPVERKASKTVHRYSHCICRLLAEKIVMCIVHTP